VVITKKERIDKTMDIKTVKKALDYKKAHLNLIQWALNQDCLIQCRV
jgi:hypothetical protein